MNPSTTAPQLSLSEINKHTIKALKKRIKEAGAQKVEKKLGFTPQNLSYHLNPKDFGKVNIQTLEKIIKAVESVEEDKLERARHLNKQVTQPAI